MENNNFYEQEDEIINNQTEESNVDEDKIIINLKKRTDGLWMQNNWLRFYTYIILPAITIVGIMFEFYLTTNNITEKLYLIVIVLIIFSACSFIYTNWPNVIGYYFNIVFIILFRYSVLILYSAYDTSLYNAILPLRFITLITYANIIYFFKRRFIFFTKKYTKDDLAWMGNDNDIVGNISVTPIYELLIPKDTWFNYYIYIAIPAFIAVEIEYIFMCFIKGQYIINIGFGAIVILFYTICTLTFIDMRSRLAYYFNVFLMVVQGFIIFIFAYEITSSIIFGIICGAIWFLINFIYFHKRKFEFFDEPY